MIGQRRIGHALEELELLARAVVGGDGFVEVKWHGAIDMLKHNLQLLLFLYSGVTMKATAMDYPPAALGPARQAGPTGRRRGRGILRPTMRAWREESWG